MDYSILAPEIKKPEYSGLDDAAIAGLINNKTIEKTRNIQVADINQYLIVTGKILAIKASQSTAAQLTVLALDKFKEFQMDKPSNVLALNAQLDGLITDNILTEQDKSIILELGVKRISKAEQLGLGVVRTDEIEYARTL